MSRMLAFLSTVTLVASAFGFDWKGEGGAVTVPAGGAAITSADIADVEALTSIALADETAAVTATGLGTALTIKANISGAATLTFKDCAGIALRGDNAGLTGHFAFENTPVTVGSNHALGGADTGAATMKCGANDAEFTFADGVDNYVDITVDKGAKFTAGAGNCFTNHGKITGTASTGTFHFGTCHLYGYVTAPRNAFSIKTLSGADVHFEKGSRMGCTYSSYTMTPSGADITGRFHLHGPVTYCGTLQYNTPCGGWVCEEENVFTNRSGGLQFALWSTRSTREVDLNGYNQRIAGFISSKPNIASDRPATLTMTAASSGDAAEFVTTPNISLGFDAVGKTMSFSSAQHTTRESLYATAGTIRFKGTSQWLGTNVVVNGGSLEVGSAKALAAGSSTGRRIVVSSGTLVVSNGVTVVSDTANIGGQELDPGQYVQADFDKLGLGDYVTCAGAIVVNGKGGAWEGWPEAGGSAYIPAGATVTVPDADVAKMAACGKIFVATGGSLVLQNKTVPLVWSVPVSGGGSVTVDATTNLVILADNSKFSGTFNFFNTYVAVSNRYGLGSTKTLAVNFDAYDKLDALRFGGEGLVCDAPIYYSRTAGAEGKNYGRIGTGLPDETLIFSNSFIIVGSHNNQLEFSFRGKIRFAGGTFGTKSTSTSNGIHLFSSSSGDTKAELWFDADVRPSMSYWFASGCIYHLDFADVSWVGQIHGYSSGPRIVCERENVLTPLHLYGCYDENSILDLNGYDQSIEQFSRRYVMYADKSPESDDAPITVTSAQPAMVTVTKAFLATEGEYGLTRQVPAFFRGEAGYEHAATCTNDFYKYVSDTVAPMVISEGALRLRDGAGWAGTNVTVKAGAELIVAATSVTNAFKLAKKASRANLVVEDGGKLTLDSNATPVVVRSCVFDGQPLAPRDYTAADNVGIAGPGTLRVRHWPWKEGLTILVR